MIELSQIRQLNESSFQDELFVGGMSHDFETRGSTSYPVAPTRHSEEVNNLFAPKLKINSFAKMVTNQQYGINIEISPIVRTNAKHVVELIFMFNKVKISNATIFPNPSGTISIEFIKEKVDFEYELHFEIGKTFMNYQIYKDTERLDSQNRVYVDTCSIDYIKSNASKSVLKATKLFKEL